MGETGDHYVKQNNSDRKTSTTCTLLYTDLGVGWEDERGLWEEEEEQ